MIEKIEHNDQLLAIILRAAYSEPGITFLTPGNYSQQLGFMKHDKGHRIVPHVHNEVRRDVIYTQETLIVRKGKLRVDFYDESKSYIFSSIVTDGDLLFLASGGHGFEILEDLEMIEIKQGPYCGDADKTRIDTSLPEKIIIRDDK